MVKTPVFNRLPILLCVASAFFVDACGEQDASASWTVTFAPDVDKASAIVVDISIRKGGCTSTDVVFHQEVRPNQQASGDEGPGPLAPGIYGFYARAGNAQCTWFAQRCVEVSLPSSKTVVVELQKLAPALVVCEAARCNNGVCGTADGGVDVDGDGVLPPQDCDNSDPSVHIGATEVCDGKDNDCDVDRSIDEGVMTLSYRDADGDGYGDTAMTMAACSVPTGYVNQSGDCDDTRSAVHPGVTEVCGGGDENCNGQTDEAGATGETIFYRDADSDGYGSPTVTISACSKPSGYVEDHTDCDDSEAYIHPGAPEVADCGIDQNCNGGSDEECPGVGAI